MCVIIAKPMGASLDEHILRECWYANSDGAGIMWSEDGTLKIAKGFMKLLEFMEFWKSREWDDVPAVLHFRIATHGLTNEKNTHPFWVFPDRLAFAHNGIMPLEDPKQKISDTQMFNRHFLKQLPRNFLSNSGITNLIEDYVYPSNKLVFLNNEGEIYIFNEEHGTWYDNGCWFSNTAWDMPIGKGSYYSGGSWKKYENLDSDLKKEDVPFDSWASGFVPCDPPTEVSHERWYCWTCQYDFNWQDVFEWERATCKGHGHLTIPQCPICNTSEQCFGIDSSGIWVGDMYIPGTDDLIDDYEANDWEKKGGKP